MTTRSGSCLCNAIQYQVTGPHSQMFVCHCDNCQKSSGSAFMSNCIFRKEQFQITHGEDALTMYIDTSNQSGEPLKRSFCKFCGSTMFVWSEGGGDKKEFVGVSSGTMAERTDLHPTIELFERDRRPWLTPVEGAVRMHTM